MKKLKARVFKYLYPTAKLWWFVRRPTTSGVRCIVRCKNKILLIKHTYGPTFYTVPGGGIKNDESIEEAAKRETYEEVGLEIADVKIIDSILYTLEYKKDTVYICDAVAETFDLNIDVSEVHEAAWFDSENLPLEISKIIGPYIKPKTK